LGEHTEVDMLEVHWIGGGIDVWKQLAVDRRWKVIEGSNSPEEVR
jgi:hypothetical protein